jgi:hypothetical protein
MVNLGKGFRGDQVMSCRSFCWAFSLVLARLEKKARIGFSLPTCSSNPAVEVMESGVYPAQIMSL